MSGEYASIGTVRMRLRAEATTAEAATTAIFVPDGGYSVKRRGETYAVFVDPEIFVDPENGSSDCLKALLVKCDPKTGGCVELWFPCSACAKSQNQNQDETEPCCNKLRSLCSALRCSGLRKAVLDAAVNQKKVEIYVRKTPCKKCNKPETNRWLLTGITIPAPDK